MSFGCNECVGLGVSIVCALVRSCADTLIVSLAGVYLQALFNNSETIRVRLDISETSSGKSEGIIISKFCWLLRIRSWKFSAIWGIQLCKAIDVNEREYVSAFSRCKSSRSLTRMSSWLHWSRKISR